MLFEFKRDWLHHPQLSLFFHVDWILVDRQKEVIHHTANLFSPPSSPWSHSFSLSRLSSILVCKPVLLLLVLTLSSSLASPLCVSILFSPLLACAAIKAQCVFPPTEKWLSISLGAEFVFKLLFVIV